MLGDDEDVFDSVTWDAPAAPATYEGPSTATSGPGFRQSTSESEDGREPHDPKWEGYLITSVKDPVKELAETKDAYVSYLVSAKVGLKVQVLSCIANQQDRRTSPSSPLLPLLRGDASKTSSSSVHTSRRTFPLVWYPLYQTSTGLVGIIHYPSTQYANARDIEYVTGDRFSPEFMERRRSE